jgi:hypothetical protein
MESTCCSAVGRRADRSSWDGYGYGYGDGVVWCSRVARPRPRRVAGMQGQRSSALCMASSQGQLGSCCCRWPSPSWCRWCNATLGPSQRITPPISLRRPANSPSANRQTRHLGSRLTSSHADMRVRGPVQHLSSLGRTTPSLAVPRSAGHVADTKAIPLPTPIPGANTRGSSGMPGYALREALAVYA